jgi:hypothetical protein
MHEQVTAWLGLLFSVVGVCLLVVGTVLALQEGGGSTFVTATCLTVGVVGIASGVRRLRRSAPPPRAPTGVRLLLGGLGFSAVGIYALAAGIADVRVGATMSAIVSFVVAPGALALGCIGLLGGLGVPLPRRHSSQDGTEGE